MAKPAPKKAAALRESYFRTMQASRLALSPRSNRFGAIRYRLYEAMSMGRVNVHLGDECILPLSDRIAWSDCLVQYAEKDASRVGGFIEDWLSYHTDDDIVDMGGRGSLTAPLGQLLECVAWPLGSNLDRSVREILDPTVEVEALRGLQRRGAEKHPLDTPVNGRLKRGCSGHLSVTPAGCHGAALD